MIKINERKEEKEWIGKEKERNKGEKSDRGAKHKVRRKNK